VIIIGLIGLNSFALSIKLKKNLEIESEGDNYLIAQSRSFDIDEKGNMYIVSRYEDKIEKWNNNYT